LDMRPDLLFLGLCAMDSENGIAAFNSEDAQIKRALIEQSGSVVIGVLNEKLSASAPFHISSVEAVADLVVEADAPRSLISSFQARGVRVHRASAPSAKPRDKPHIITREAAAN
jgi:DeoR/GlpR family transcriptional regulator of sugar metabolism